MKYVVKAFLWSSYDSVVFQGHRVANLPLLTPRATMDSMPTLHWVSAKEDLASTFSAGYFDWSDLCLSVGDEHGTYDAIQTVPSTLSSTFPDTLAANQTFYHYSFYAFDSLITETLHVDRMTDFQRYLWLFRELAIQFNFNSMKYCALGCRMFAHSTECFFSITVHLFSQSKHKFMRNWIREFA